MNSLVEVPAEIADSIIETLRTTTIKGKRVPVRRDRELASEEPEKPWCGNAWRTSSVIGRRMAA